MAIKYYSTNRELEGGFKRKVSFTEALFTGMAPDKGLFMPSEIPSFSLDELRALKGRPYREVAYAVLKKFLSGEVPDLVLAGIVKDAYDFEVPIGKVGGVSDALFVMRLDQGPTASFKDFAARVMARLMLAIKPKKEEITVLVATSGDTGSAIGNAYRGLDGINVFILYPENEVTPVQKNQLDSIGGNVQAISLDGKFDDCQRLVKEAFSDPELKHLSITSANSINIGRILPQIAYYFYAYVNVADLANNFPRVVFSVPSGNFGNSLGCELARRMGLPVEKLIIATNENDEFPRLLKTGDYEKVVPSKNCLSNAMNVGNPSNLARYFALYGGILDKEGKVHKQPDLNGMRKSLYSVPVTDDETVKTIKYAFERYNTMLEPHGAVGFAAALRYVSETGWNLSLIHI